VSPGATRPTTPHRHIVARYLPELFAQGAFVSSGALLRAAAALARTGAMNAARHLAHDGCLGRAVWNKVLGAFERPTDHLAFGDARAGPRPSRW
jgi:hypothetical protein